MILGVDCETSMSPRMFPWVEGAYLSLVVAIEQDEVSGHRTVHHWVFNHNSVGMRPQAVMVTEIQNLMNRASLVVGHNWKFDLHWMKKLGLKPPKCHDTMVCEYLINGQDNRIGISLDESARRYGFTPKLDAVKEYWKSGIDTANIPYDTLLEYCIHDVELTLDLYAKQLPRLDELGLVKLARLHNMFVECLQEIEGNGMKVDREFLTRTTAEYFERMEICRVELQLFIQEFFNTDFIFNLSSNDHLSVILYGGNIPLDYRETYSVILKSGEEKQRERWAVKDVPFDGLGFKPNKKDACKKAGFYKTSKTVLATLNAKTKAQKHFVEAIKELSGIEKIYSTYLEGMEKHIRAGDIIHPSFNQAFTVTGRLSSSAPNFQNLPRGGTDVVAKRIFIPKQSDRFILNGDLSALEWCVGAQLSYDEVMIDEICSDIDIHTANSIAIFGSDEYRQASKTVSFRSLYGGSAYAFFMDANMPRKTLAEWEDIHAKFYRKYRMLGDWQNRNFDTVCLNGWYQSFTGRRYVFHKENGVYSKPAVCNYIVQGTATGDIVPFAMMLIRKQIRDAGLDAQMICQVHDSVVLDVAEKVIDDVASIVWNVFNDLPKTIKQYWGYNWYVPLTGEIECGPNYKDLTKIWGKKGRI